MNPTETGKTIASLRKKAGYTQASLGEILGISDKAISKWERGIACPDISFLPKLSMLFDTDIESILNGSAIVKGHHWKGILLVDELHTSIVYSKPLVYFLISNFMLVGIRDILIVGREVQKLLGTGEKYGLHLKYEIGNIGDALRRNPIYMKFGTLITYGNVLIYGGSLTSRYQGIMSLESGAHQLISNSGVSLPVIFCTFERWKDLSGRPFDWRNPEDIERDIKPLEKRLGRGVVCLPMTNYKEITEAGLFVKIIEENCSEKIADLNELAINRTLPRN